MAGAAVQTEGFESLSSTLKTAARDIQTLPDANAEAGDVIASAARERAPKRTGALAETVMAQVERDGVVISAGEPPRVSYAGPVEFGTRFTRAQPYLFPATADTQDKWTRAYQDGVDEAMRKVHGA